MQVAPYRQKNRQPCGSSIAAVRQKLQGIISAPKENSILMLPGHIDFVDGFSKGRSVHACIDRLDMKDKISLAE